MVVTSSTDINQNTYKDGKIQQNAIGKLAGFGSRIPGFGAKAPTPGATRTFVTGEKMWVTNIDVRNNAIVFDLFTDAFGDNRYKASLSIPFPKGLSADSGSSRKDSRRRLLHGSAIGRRARECAAAVTPAPAAQQAEAPPAPIAPPPATGR